MVSNIDPTKPETGIDQPVQVIRDNFAYAKIEIEELQARKLEIEGGAMAGVLLLAPFNTVDLPDPVINTAGLVYVPDGSPTVGPFFSNGTNWYPLFISQLNDISDVNVGTPGLAEDGYGLVWDNTAGEFQLSPSGGGSLNNVVEDLTPQLGGELDAQNFKITNLGTPIVNDDAVTKEYVDDNFSLLIRSINAQTGVLYILALSDAGNVLTMDNPSLNSIVIPLNVSVAFQIGTQIDIIMKGAGTTSIDADTGVTLNDVNAGSAAISNQYSAATILKIDTDEWIIFGDHGGVI